MDFHRWQIALAAQPFHRLRMDFESAAGLYHVKIIVPRLHRLRSDKYCFIKAILTPESAFVKRWIKVLFGLLMSLRGHYTQDALQKSWFAAPHQIASLRSQWQTIATKCKQSQFKGIATSPAASRNDRKRGDFSRIEVRKMTKSCWLS